MSMDAMSLDQTMEVPAAASNGIVEETEIALRKLKAYEAEISEFREELDRLRAPGAGLTELRRLVDGAVQLQAKMNLSPDLLSRDMLMQAGIPVEELEQARSVLQALQSCEKASEQARSHLVGRCQPSTVDDFAGFLEAFSKLRALTSRLQQQKGRSAVAEVDVGMDKRQVTSAQLCEALLDQASAAPPNAELSAKIQKFIAQDWVKQELAILSVEVPRSLSTVTPVSSEMQWDASACSGTGDEEGYHLFWNAPR
jgi:hypothetical protein